MALKNEFNDSFGEMPDNYMDWLDGAAFCKKVGEFARGDVAIDDRGSDFNAIKRPMFILSNYYSKAVE